MFDLGTASTEQDCWFLQDCILQGEKRDKRQGTCSKEASLRGGDLNDFSYYTSFLPTRQSVSMKRGDIVYKLLRGST